MSGTLSAEVKQLIDRPNFAHLATLMPDGAPQSVPVWVGREGDHIVICTTDSSLKGKNTRREPRIALSIVDFENPYEEAQIRGRVILRRSDSELRTLDSLSHKYMGKPFPMRDHAGAVALIIEAEKVRYLKLPFAHMPPK